MYVDRMFLQLLPQVLTTPDLRTLTKALKKQRRAGSLHAHEMLAYWEWIIGAGRPGKKIKKMGSQLATTMWRSLPQVTRLPNYPHWKTKGRLGTNAKMVFCHLLQRERNELIAFLKQYVPEETNERLIKGLGRFHGIRAMLRRALVSGHHTLRVTEPVRNYQALRDMIITWVMFCLEASPRLFALPVAMYWRADAFSKRFAILFGAQLWEQCVIWSGHDSATNMECREWHTGEGERRTDLVWRATRGMKCRIACEPGHESIEVCVQYRRKNAIDVIAGLLADKDPPIRDITEVPDYHGWRFLFERDEDIDRFLVLPAVKKFFADCKIRKDTRRGGKVNRFSSSVELVSLKQRLPGIWLGGEEFQLMTIPHFLDAEYNTHAVGHELYKLRVHLDVTLPWLFPRELFVVDWADMEVRAQCEAHVKARLRQ